MAGFRIGEFRPRGWRDFVFGSAVLHLVLILAVPGEKRTERAGLVLLVLSAPLFRRNRRLHRVQLELGVPREDAIPRIVVRRGSIDRAIDTVHMLKQFDPRAPLPGRSVLIAPALAHSGVATATRDCRVNGKGKSVVFSRSTKTWCPKSHDTPRVACLDAHRGARSADVVCAEARGNEKSERA